MKCFPETGMTDPVAAATSDLMHLPLPVDRDFSLEKKSELHDVFAELFENSHDVIITLARDTTITLLNPAFETITGWQRSEWLGKVFPQLVHPDDLPRAAQIVKSVILGNKTDTFDLRIRGKSGMFNSIEFTVAPRQVDGKIVGLLGIGRDVTQRKHVESALSESQARWRSIAQNAPDTIMTVDHDGTILFINRSISEYGGGRAIGTTIFQNAPPEYHETLRIALQRVMESGETVSCEVAGNAGGPTNRWYSMRMGPIRNEDSIVAATLILTDITERMRAEADVLEWKNRYEAAIQASGHILYDWDPTADEITYGGNVEKTLGFTAEELNGPLSRSMALIHPENRAAMELEIQSVLFSRSPLHVEYRVQKKDGQYCVVRNDGYFVLDANGNIARMVGFIVDISAQRALEDQLRHSQKMEAFGRLAGGVAHDFNNLLTVISGYNEIVLHDLSPNDPRRDCVEEIGKAAERASSLTAQLLAFSRQQVLQPKVFEINSVFSDVSKMLRRLIGEDIKLVTVPSPERSCVKADLGQLENVLVNLAVNARDAMPQGGTLTIKTAIVKIDPNDPEIAEGLKPGEHVLLTVSDTGTGIPPEVRKQIFEPFFTTKAVGRGTGLGLATCYGIVKQSGGHISVESEVGSGTTFKIHLPRVEEPHASDVALESMNKLQGGTETILVVEDEPMVRRLAVAILIDLGYRVLEAANGEEALRVAQANKGSSLDLVITDIVMPGMSGKALALWIRSTFPQVKILFTSGYPNHELDEEDAIGANALFMPKPFAPKKLAEHVRLLLDQAA